MKKLCLNMIVKNEAAILDKMLVPMLSVIDYYIICDTGSTDDTPAIIKKFFDVYGLSGEVHHIEFINFEYARNTALKLAQNSDVTFDYILLCDADMELRVIDIDFKNKLMHDYYLIRQENQNLSYYNVRLVKKNVVSHYVGVTHEYLHLEGTPYLSDMFYFYEYGNGGNRPQKYQRDVQLLTEGLVKEPMNSRYHFYMAQTYYDLAQFTEAQKFYRKRIALGEWYEEVYFSYYQLGMIEKKLNQSEEKILTAFLNAYSYHPARAEPLYELANYYRSNELYAKGYLFASASIKIVFPSKDILFVSKDVYDYKRWDELAVCAYWVGQYEESFQICQRLLTSDFLPESERARIIKNSEFAKLQLKTN